MAIFTDKADVLLNTLRDNPRLSKIEFNQAMLTHRVKRPVSKKICTVGIKDTFIQSDLYSYETFLLKIYTPVNAGGNECQSVAGEIGECLLKNVSGLISIASGSVQYDADALAFTCEMTVKCKISEVIDNIYEDEEVSVTVFIDGKSFDARYINSYENNNFKPLYQLWSNEPVNFYPNMQLHVIEIKSFPIDVIDNIDDLNNFTLGFDDVIYTGCHVTDIKYDLARRRVDDIQIYAKGKQVVCG
ncbi:MAG: hypothetical protein PUC88_02400 [Clostridia bacterium]|nr:hypothetical protein [Clostridia bacterium]